MTISVKPPAFVVRGIAICFCRKLVSEVGFEPTPTFVDQNTPVRKSSTLESGALDRSAILTCHFQQGDEYLFSNSTPSSATPWKPLKPQPFDRCTSHLSCPEQPGELAQMVERSIRIREARGSIPRFSTRKYFFTRTGRRSRDIPAPVHAPVLLSRIFIEN